MRLSVRAPLAFVLFFLLLPGVLFAQQTGSISGTVETARRSVPAEGVNVVVIGTLYGAITDSTGGFRLDDLPPGSYTLMVNAFGYRPLQEVVRVEAGMQATVRFRLRTEEIELEDVAVMALRADLQPVASLGAPALQRRNALTSGTLLRDLPGAAAGRTSVLGFDASVRALSARQLGVIVDGAPVSYTSLLTSDASFRYLDPSALASIEIVKGPYALTWGAGAQGLVWVQTRRAMAPEVRLRGAVEGGYRSNLGVWEGAASAGGTVGDLEYGLHGAYRTGDDYESGGDQTVPADFRAGELGGRIGYRLSPSARLTVAAGYQQVTDLDVPLGLFSREDLLFSREDLKAGHGMVRYQKARAAGLVRGIDVLAYGTDIRQDMALTDAAGALRIVPPHADLEGTDLGGRLAFQLAPAGSLALEAGGDVRTRYRNATAVTDGVSVADILPDTRITEVGAFVQGSRPLGRIEAAATARTDFVHAAAGRVTRLSLSGRPLSLFGASDLAHTETNVSAATTFTLPLSPVWQASAGVGSVVRTADAVERYGGPLRASASGTLPLPNPRLRPERSTQADLWLAGAYPRLDAHIGVFARRVSDYITLQPSALDLSVPGLHPAQYQNHSATFYGAGVAAAYALFSEYATLNFGAHYVWGQDETRGAPAAGVMPLSGHLGVLIQAPANLFFLEGMLHAAAGHDRVGLDEVSTDGYVTADLRFGLRLPRAAALLVGFDNLTDAEYVHPLSRSEVQILGTQLVQRRVPEPGRVFFIRLRKAF